jgi:hypothetical protein
MDPIHRRGFLGVVGAVLAGSSAAAAAPRSSHPTPRVAPVGDVVDLDLGAVVDLDLGAVVWSSLHIDYAPAGSSARWIAMNRRPTLGQRVRVTVAGDYVFVGAIVRYTLITAHPPTLAPYWEVYAESDELIAGRRWLLRDEGLTD